MGDAFDLLLRHLERLLSYPGWLPIERHEIFFYCDKLRFRIARSTWNLKDVFRFRIDHSTWEFKDLITVRQKIDQLGRLVTDILEQKNESTAGQDFGVHGPPFLSHLGTMVRDVLLRLYDINLDLDDNKDEYEPNFHSGLSFDQANIEREVCVGFEGEARHLLDQLTATKPIHLQVISIVGMSGLGKTTLARKVYNDPLIVYHFYIRAWVNVSQVYRKRDLLLGILSSVIDVTDQVCGMNANDLAQVLYRGLKGKRYLIVVDDIWNIEAWEDIKRSFPNDNNGSRVMLTTRVNDVAMHAQSDRKPLCLRFLTEKESWDLFETKAFLNPWLSGTNMSDIVKSISRKCQGLPLAIVVIAGLLKYIEIDRWEQVVENVSSYVASDPKHYMDTLALSYHHLPPHLKPCFLYLGAFPEDYEIPVRKLIWLWIAEEFICQTGRKSLEDVAEDYLMDLLPETLKLLNTAPISGGSGGASSSVMFPERLKRLTISSTNLEWKEAWIFEMIPNLEVLKLKMHAFVGQEWETSDGLFPRLKFLKFEELNIVNWSASSSHFPKLQRLVVHRCQNLQEIPPGFGNVFTLEWIELSGCNETAINSAREIQREELDNGNNFLKILINPMANSF